MCVGTQDKVLPNSEVKDSFITTVSWNSCGQITKTTASHCHLALSVSNFMAGQHKTYELYAVTLSHNSNTVTHLFGKHPPKSIHTNPILSVKPALWSSVSLFLQAQ